MIYETTRTINEVNEDPILDVDEGIFRDNGIIIAKDSWWGNVLIVIAHQGKTYSNLDLGGSLPSKMTDAEFSQLLKEKLGH